MRASHREVFGKKPADYSNWAFTIAESEIDLRTARLLTLEGAWKATAGLDYRHEAYVAKVHTARVANRIADTMLQLHGGMGYAMELPLERWYRDLRVIRIYEGSDEVNLASIARNLFSGNVKPGDVLG